MNILFVGTETSPYYKTSDVADVVYGLAKELFIQGHDVRIIVPRYRASSLDIAGTSIIEKKEINPGAYSRSAELLKTEGSPIFYFIEQEFYFGRDDFYGYADDHERFIFFTRFALEMLLDPNFRQKEEWFPEIIQGFDWATGMIPSWLSQYRGDNKISAHNKLDESFSHVRFFLYVHNIRRLGKCGGRALALAEQEYNGFYRDDFERMQNFAQRGLKRPYQVLILVTWDVRLPEKQIEQIQARMRIHAMDVVVADIASVLQLLNSPRSFEA